jgi:hypothetical protein
LLALTRCLTLLIHCSFPVFLSCWHAHDFWPRRARRLAVAMKSSSNGINSDGSSCNVGNALSTRPSIRLLPFGVASNSGDAVKNALFSGWGGDDADDEPPRSARKPASRPQSGGRSAAHEAVSSPSRASRQQQVDADSSAGGGSSGAGIGTSGGVVATVSDGDKPSQAALGNSGAIALPLRLPQRPMALPLATDSTTWASPTGVGTTVVYAQASNPDHGSGNSGRGGDSDRARVGDSANRWVQVEERKASSVQEAFARGTARSGSASPGDLSTELCTEEEEATEAQVWRALQSRACVFGSVPLSPFAKS